MKMTATMHGIAQKRARTARGACVNNDSLRMAWSNSDAGNGKSDMVYLKMSGGDVFFKNNTMTPYTVGTYYHISMRIVQNADGSAVFTWSKRNVSTGEIEKTCTVDVASSKGWSLARYAGNPFLLNSGYDNDDEAATYDEVRIWQGALSDAALTASAKAGPDATGEILTAIVASGRVLELAGGTLNLGGRTLTQPVVKGGSGAVMNGKLVVADNLEVNLADCIAGSCVEVGGVIDLSGATLELEDPEALVTRRGAITILRGASDGSIVGIPECPQLLKGWKVVKSGNDLKLRKASGVMIMVN